LACGGDDRRVHVRRVSDWKAVVNALRGHQGAVQAVAFSADNRTLASAAYDGLVLLWQLDPPNAAEPAKGSE
jgi:WD40 repeat protein